MDIHIKKIEVKANTSGYFKNGKQTGKWITYPKIGKEFKITSFDKK